MCLNHPGKVIALTGSVRAVAEHVHETATAPVLDDGDMWAPTFAPAEMTPMVEAASPNP